LFFVLSGYLIGAQLLRPLADGRSPTVVDFYLKRFFRIIPAYLVVVGAYFSIPGFREHEGIAPLWKFLTFTQNLGYHASDGRAFSHAWSLCVEEHFYLIVPLLVAVLARWRIGRWGLCVVGLVFLGGLALRAYSWNGLEARDGNWLEWIYYPTYNRLDGLLAGVGIAATEIFAARDWRRLTRRPSLLLVMGIAILAIAYALCTDRTSFVASVFGFPLVAAGYGLVVIAAVSPSSVLHRVGFEVTSALAAISYSLYLVHKATIHVSQSVLSDWGVASDGLPALLLAVVVSCASAWLLYVAVERPFMKLRSLVLANRWKARKPRTGFAH
jgi:peptidoglycan/LPS O-acetylase OafA/YrhL